MSYSPSRDLTPVVPKKNRALFFFLIGLMSLTVMLALMPTSLGISALTPFPADPSILPLGAASYMQLWAEPYALGAAVLGFPLLAGLLLRFVGIKYTALVALLLGLGSYGALQAELRELPVGQGMPLQLVHALLLTASLVLLSITCFSAMVQLGAQSTAARRLLSVSALSLVIPILYCIALFCSQWLDMNLGAILYGVFVLPLALWLLKGCITLKGYDLALDSRDSQQCLHSGNILCRLIALLSPLMLYSLQIFLILNLMKLTNHLVYRMDTPLQSHWIAVGGVLLLLFILRSVGVVILNKRGRLSVLLALLTASLVPAKLADFMSLRKHPLLYPCLLVSFSMLLWYAMMHWAGSIRFFYLF